MTRMKYMSKQFSFFIHPEDEMGLLELTAQKTNAILIPEFYKSTRDKIVPLRLSSLKQLRQSRRLFLTRPIDLTTLRIIDRKDLSYYPQKFNQDRYCINSNASVIEYIRCPLENHSLTRGRLYAQTKYICDKDGSSWEKRMKTAYFVYPPPEYLRWITKVFSLWKRNLKLYRRTYFSKRAWESFCKERKEFVSGSGMEKIKIE